MPMSELITGARTARWQSLDEASRAAIGHLQRHLRRNVLASETLRSMQQLIQLFKSYAPRLFVSKCIDGRVHGSDGKGFPPTTVTFTRTDGNQVELVPENITFWNRINSVVLDARRHTAGSPAVLIALAHRGKLGSGCAAHHGDDAAALAAVADQAQQLRQKFKSDDLYVMHGLTNTDDGAEVFVFPDGREINTERIIRTLDTPAHPLRKATDLFQPEFLDRPIDDPLTDRYLQGRRPREVVEGAHAPGFHDLQTMIALETYLVQEVSRVVRNRTRNNVVFDPRLFDEVLHTLQAVHGFPENLVAPLLYVTLWNVGFTLHHRERLATLDPDARERYLQHAEDMIGYGDGFEIEKRNTLVLAKPGRGDDQIALSVARQVLLKNRGKYPQPFPPLVHINVEIAGDMDRWEAFNRDVLAPLQTRVDNVFTVFGDDCRVLTTYSRAWEKCFYPVRINSDAGPVWCNDPRECFPFDVTRGLTDRDFNRDQLALREQVYRQKMSLDAMTDVA